MPASDTFFHGRRSEADAIAIAHNQHPNHEGFFKVSVNRRC